MDPYKQTLINDEESYKCQNLSTRTVKKKKYWRHKELGLGRAVGPIIGGEAGHWARIARYDSTANANTLHAIRVHTLFVFSEHDVMVPPLENTDYAKKIFPKGLPSYIEVYLQTGIDHFMHAAESRCDPYPWTLNPTPPYSAELKKKIRHGLLPSPIVNKC
jgi:pimeloyl-ACP methyl ester carboxylesterase